MTKGVEMRSIRKSDGDKRDRPRRTSAQSWRAEPAAEDTAPTGEPPPLAPEQWGTTAAEARAMLRRQICPVCGEGPWKSPLTHAAKKHGIDGFRMRDACGLVIATKVTDPEFSERVSERARRNDMAAVARTGKRGPKTRLTAAGRAQVTANLAAVTPNQSRAALRAARTPEAQARRSASLRAKWAAATPEERAEWGRRVGGNTEHMEAMNQARWAKQGLQPCGTVAAYKRGCRCAECRTAKRNSRA